MVHDQLRQLLLEHDCVTLPGFGALLAEPVPARIHPVRHTLSPPARRVAFSERLRHDDGLLTAAVRRALPVTEAAAAPARVRSFTEELRAALRQHRAAELRGLGTLRQTTETEPIRFEALEPGYLPLTSSFGLPELVSRPVVLTERSRATRYVPESAPNTQLRAVPSRLRRLVGEGTEPLYRLATTAVVVLCVTAAYFRMTPLDERFRPGAPLAIREIGTEMAEPQRAYVATADPIVTPLAAPATVEEPVTTEPAPVTTTAVAPVAEAASLSDELAKRPSKRAPAPDAMHRPAPAPVAHPPVATAESQPVHTAATGRYYLIWNAFATKAKAEKGRTQVLGSTPADATNVPSVLTPPRGSSLYRVAVADFATEAEAQAAKPALRARYGPALWVLHY